MRFRIRDIGLAISVSIALAGAVQAQVISTDFAHTPHADWSLSGGVGSATPLLGVTGTGDNSNYWQRKYPNLRPGSTYRVGFRARISPGSTPNIVISGPTLCNRDYGVSTDWQDYGFVFTTPNNLQDTTVRLGQWHLKGTVSFQSITMVPVAPVYLQRGQITLGEGETVRGTAYSFVAPLNGEGSNCARPLLSHTAGFNSNRWIFSEGSEVIYRHEIAKLDQCAASLTLSLGYYNAGSCQISVSRDGRDWQELTPLSKPGINSIDLPANLFPTTAIYIRLRGSQASSYQIDGYTYRATLRSAVPDITGTTRYLQLERQDPRIAVRGVTLGETAHQTAGFQLTSNLPAVKRLTASITCEQPGAPTFIRSCPVDLSAGTAQVSLPMAIKRRAGAYSIRLKVGSSDGKQIFYLAVTQGVVPQYLAENYGYALPALAGCSAWWCESGFKVPPTRSAPTAPSAAIRISGAAGERVHTQLILTPAARDLDVGFDTSDLIDARGDHLRSNSVTIRKVDYVPVRQPTDSIGIAGEWPDALSPLKGNHSRLSQGRNNPFWITVTIPTTAHAGDYSGSILIAANGKQSRLPVKLHLFGFALPQHTDLRSGFGISPEIIRRYHHLKTQAELEQVWDLYMRDFAAHRLCCYNPMALAEIGVKETKGEHPGVDLDFAAFDKAAHRYLDIMGFNAFTINILGLGGGRYPNYDRGQFLGHPAGTPEYDSLMREYATKLQAHLAANHWIEKGYVYWYDEPEANDYPFVVDGMSRLKRYFPHLKRMLTEGFRAPLYGNVDLWCPITPKFEVEPSVARQSLGEEVWWYVCTGPKEPWCGLFIDHPGTEMRMWMWQTWKYHIQGVLIWETTWWTSKAQFKDRDQDPWTDPMSYTSESTGVWGNGDGRLFYPPLIENGSQPIMAAPIDSIRWEMLAQGVQDWEYFHLLARLVKSAELRGAAAASLAKAGGLLTIPDSICKDMTHFTADAVSMDRWRDRVAAEIERLGRVVRSGNNRN